MATHSAHKHNIIVEIIFSFPGGKSIRIVNRHVNFFLYIVVNPKISIVCNLLEFRAESL